MKKINVIVFGDKFDRKIKKIEIDNNYKALGEIVEGKIEYPYISREFEKRNIDVIVNEEGLNEGFLPTVLIIDKEEKMLGHLVGNIIFASSDEEGNTLGLNKEQVEYLQKKVFRLTAEVRFDENSEPVDCLCFQI